MNQSFEDLIADINANGWTLHSLSQYRSFGKLVWSATVRRDGPDRQPISPGQHVDMLMALLIAIEGIPDAKLEPEITVHAKAKEPPIMLANLLPARPALVIRRR